MQTSPEYLRNVITNDFKSLLDMKAAKEKTEPVQEYLGLQANIKNKNGEICADMLNLYRTFGIQSIATDVATAYVKSDYDILRDRLTPAQIVAIYDYNPSAFKVTDKSLRDTIKLANLAMANGDNSEGVQAILEIDLDKLRGPVKHSAVLRVGANY